MKIVTSGSTYLDIDAYAGCIAYAELLQRQGYQAQAISTAPWNVSVSHSVRSWGGDISDIYQPQTDDKFTLIDVSVPTFFDTFVDVDRVEAVIDHHIGYEDFWQKRIGDSADIEFVGAACTQVYEHWQKAGLLQSMSVTSARLLMTGILDNTLCFKANVTTGRDKSAYQELAKTADLSDDWPALYFGECQGAVESSLIDSIRNDTKVLSEEDVARYGHRLPARIGQLVVWDAHNLVENHRGDISEAMADKDEDGWLINIVSISEGVSYLASENTKIQSNIKEILGLPDFQNGHAVSDRLWLRKEIFKAASVKNKV